MHDSQEGTQGGRQSRIAKNAATGSSIVIGKIHESNSVNCSFNAESSSYVDMVKAGIIDPTKIQDRACALQEVASVAGLLEVAACALIPDTESILINQSAEQHRDLSLAITKR